MTGFRIDDLALEVLKRAVHKTVQHALYFLSDFISESVHNKHLLRVFYSNAYPEVPVVPVLPANLSVRSGMPSLPLLPEQLHYEQLHVHLFPM